jgi:hypothetical protein
MSRPDDDARAVQETVPPTLLRVCVDAIRRASAQGRRVSGADLVEAARKEREVRHG